MGNWTIIIEGTGQHHNNGDPKDADVIAHEFTDALLRAGQSVEHSTFTSGGRLDYPLNLVQTREHLPQ